MLIIYNSNNQQPSLSITAKKRRVDVTLRKICQISFPSYRKSTYAIVSAKTHPILTINSIEIFKMSIVTFFEDPDFQFLGSTLQAEHGRDEGRTLKRLENRLLEVIVAFYRMFTRYLAGAFWPALMMLVLKALHDVQPGDLMIIGLFANRFHQEAILGRVRLSTDRVIFLELYVIRGRLLGSDQKTVLYRGLAKLPIDSLLGARTGGRALVAEGGMDVDDLWQRLAEFPLVYGVEVLESNLILLD